MRVRVDCPCDAEPEVLGKCLVTRWEPRRIDDRAGTIIEVDQVRRMTQSFVDELVDSQSALLLKELLE
jgi:hypothetical protein